MFTARASVHYPLPPKAAGELIAKSATHVKIKKEGVRKLAKTITEEVNSGRLSVHNFSQNEFHPKPEDPWALDWLFVVDTLNFCFWHPDNHVGWVVDGKSGYFALCAAINRAMEQKIDILNPQFYASITEEQLAKVLQSDTITPVPLFAERISVLHEVGTILLEKFEGSFKNCVEQANNSAMALLKIITDNFNCFKDETEYKGSKVCLYKRAQILVADIWSCFQNTGPGHFKDIDEITMFADYRVPQALLYFNVLEYSPDLTSILSKETLLDYGSELEVEIRGCSIHAVTLLTDHAKKHVHKGKTINAILVDHFLWDFRRNNAQEIAKKGLPFHKTFSIFY